jgi:CHAD domain-containing protein
VNEPLAVAARRIVHRRAAAFLGRAQRAIGQGRAAELHATRIAGKRLRYNVEFFASQLGPDRKTVLGLLTLIQDRLGAIADAEAFVDAGKELLRILERDDPRAAGIRAHIAACRARRDDDVARLVALWRGDEHSPYPDMLVASLAASLASTSSKTA